MPAACSNFLKLETTQDLLRYVREVSKNGKCQNPQIPQIIYIPAKLLKAEVIIKKGTHHFYPYSPKVDN